MSESDDRMERAERIRQMRESRESSEDSEAGDGGESSDAGVAEEDTAGGDRSADGGPDDEPPDDERPEDGSSVDRPDSEQTSSTEQAVERSNGDGSPGKRSADENAGDAPATDLTAGGATTDGNTDPGRPQSAESSGGAGVQDASPSDGVAPLGGASGFSLPGQEEIDAAAGGIDDSEDPATTTGAARARDSATAASTEASVRVLEFTVGEQVYCIDIESVEEIVKREAVTRVPNTEGYVEGVVDLRGQITTILDTRQLLDVEEVGPEDLLVIFAPDGFEEHGTVGWVVDEVRQVVPVADSQVRSAPSQEEHVRGIVDREDEDDLVVWIRPDDAMDRAITNDAE